MKKVLYVIIGLIVLYLILCIFGRSEYIITRSIHLNADEKVVKAQLADLQFFQEKWSPWSEKDPNMKVTYSGERGKIGSGYKWEGNKEVGKGSLEFIAISGDSLIQKLSFEDMGDSKTFYVVTKENNVTSLTWGIHFTVDFLGRGMMMFMDMDKMMGADFEKGLSKFKSAVESMPAQITTTNYEVKEINWEEKTFVGKKGIYKFDQLSAFFAETYPDLFNELGKAKQEPLMAPCAIYFKWDQDKGETECAAVACVKKGVVLKKFESFILPSSKVLHIAYYGSWSKSMNAHMAMDEYIKNNSLPLQSQVIEEYVTDPMIEKDTAKWLTNIYYVIPSAK